MTMSSGKISVFLFLVFTLMISLNSKGQTLDKNIKSPAGSDSIFSEVEAEASFPGGARAWTTYITEAITENARKFKKSDYGTCIVKFIVDTKGRVSATEAITMQKSRLAKIAIEAISNGPRWNPAQQNGKFVNAYRLQPIILTEPDK